MIRTIKSYDECRAFAADFHEDENFSDPMLCTEEQVRGNLIKSIAQPERHCVFGVYRGEQLVGLFAFLVLHDERYLEMLVGLSRERDAYLEMFCHVEKCYPAYRADFVFNPGNCHLRELLALRGAEFEPEQQKMVFGGQAPTVDTSGIELLSARYAAQYCALHNKNMYWTGEKVLQAQDRFRTFLALHGETVVGYLDVTYIFEENEPFDLYVAEKYRRMGYARKLLAAALERNRPRGMMLLVATDNAPALSLYASMGFAKVTGQNNLTAHLTL